MAVACEICGACGAYPGADWHTPKHNIMEHIYELEAHVELLIQRLDALEGVTPEPKDKQNYENYKNGLAYYDKNGKYIPDCGVGGELGEYLGS